MQLSGVSKAFMLASMVQRAMAEGPQDTPEYDAMRAALFLFPSGLALILCCYICYSKIENSGGLGRDSRRRDHISDHALTAVVSNGSPSAPLSVTVTGIPVSADLGLAPEGSPSFAGIGQLSPSPEALALSASPSLATIPNSSDPV
jgi:hypothetical protein